MKIYLLLLPLLAGLMPLSSAAPQLGAMHRKSSFVERERPELNEATKQLIAAYRAHPTQANYKALKHQVAANYDAVIARKQAKLDELRREARHASLVREMEAIVDEVVKDRDQRIEQSMRRFTDPRLRPGVRENKDGFLPVIGARSLISMAYTPVTNAEYDAFVKATKRRPAPRWRAGQEQLPVVGVSIDDAKAYCRWLSETRGETYRLPTAEEWEQAAGHMPKDADFNNGSAALSPVTAYAHTLSACGAVDMWGNCWEWTTTPLDSGQCAVKGGAYDSERMECRTEERDIGRRSRRGYDNVGFRLVREDKETTTKR
ncbi:MAG: formylglycine-generating enzyme family protein [Akkermansia sp.]